MPSSSPRTVSPVSGPFQAKVARLRRGSAPRVLDLFAGCGGISLGFERMGFEVAAGLDIGAEAAATHALNFHGGDAVHGLARDITQIEPEQLASDFGWTGDVAGCIDVIVGGP